MVSLLNGFFPSTRQDFMILQITEKFDNFFIAREKTSKAPENHHSLGLSASID